MSVNPLGVSAYTKIERFDQRNRSEAAQTTAELAKQTEVSGKTAVAEKISIPQKSGAESSALAVANDSSLASILSAEEKQAIDELFAKYDFSKSEGAGYGPLGETGVSEDANAIGRKVDFRV